MTVWGCCKISWITARSSRTSHKRSDVSRLAVSSRARGLDNDRLAGLQGGRVGALQALHAAVQTAHPVLADLARLAACKAERPHTAVAGQDGAFHRFEKPDGAADAIAGIPFPTPAGAGADVEILKQYRVAEFQHLRIGETRIRHMRVYRVGAVKPRPRRRAGADRLVIQIGNPQAIPGSGIPAPPDR